MLATTITPPRTRMSSAARNTRSAARLRPLSWTKYGRSFECLRLESRSGRRPGLPEVGFANQLGAEQLGGRTGQHHLAGLQHEATMRNAQRHVGVLLDDE